MVQEYIFELGSYRGNPYFLMVKAVPDINDPEDFAITAFYRTREEKVEIARIDTSHGFTHFDRLFEQGEPKEDLHIGFYEAWEILQENWKTYARRYERNK